MGGGGAHRSSARLVKMNHWGGLVVLAFPSKFTL